MKNLHLVLVLFSIASMFTSFGVYDVDATKYENNGNTNGCDNGNEKVKEKNPHCNNGGTAPPTECGDDPLDCDSDGVSNNMEVSSGCMDPFNPDTDGDTFWDGVEIDAGSDPCAADSIPIQ